MSINPILKQLVEHQDLSETSAFDSFSKLFKGEMSPAQSGAFLFGLSAKGETTSEIKSAVKAALSQARTVSGFNHKCIDTCGTGGDGKKSFNCSTAVALFLSEMGYKVVKHGNRAVSGNCGSADIIEMLQIPFIKDPKEVPLFLEKTNFAFLFAPYFHPSFTSIAPIRQELGIPTLFNILGPLLNPARPTHQLIGVGNIKYLQIISEVLAQIDIKRAAVLHGAEGFDELTPCGTSQIILVQDGQCQPMELNPSLFEISLCNAKDLACYNKQDSIEVMRSILNGQGPQAIQDMVVLNLGLCLYLLQEDSDLSSCILQAKKTVQKGVDIRRLYA